MRSALTLVIWWAMACSWQSSFAQCGSTWVDGPATAINGVNGPIYASLSWDHDNSPGTPNWLVVGGDFTIAGATYAYNIAAWDGVTWHKFGLGTNGLVRVLGIHNGLVIGGDFTLADSLLVNHIARWDGSDFQPLGGGVTGGSSTTVKALLTIGSNLYVGGAFQTAGGTSASNVAWWTGSSWVAMGDGLNDAVNTLQPIGLGFVLAGGSFDSPDDGGNQRIALWDGTDWDAYSGGFPNCFAVSNSFDSHVNALHHSGGELYAGGKWSGGIIDPPGPPVYCYINGLAQVNNQWWVPEELYQTPVNAITTYSGQLIANDRTSAADWEPLGGGVNGTVFALAVHNGELYVCGDFTSAGGENGIPAGNIARWNGSTWSDVTPAVGVRSFATHAGSLVAGGNFIWPASPENLEYISQYDDGDLTNIGSGNLDGAVHAAVVHNSQLIIGGEFAFPGPDHQSINRIAVLDVFTDDWYAMDDGFNNTVHALTVHNGSLFAAGIFTASGATSIDRIARWQSNPPGGFWQALADGGANGAIYALKSYNGFLYAGGSFASVGGESTGGLARWNGSSWSNVGGFFNGIVYALEVHNNELVIAGLYPGLPGSPNIAKYNGSFYSTLATGGTNNAVRSLKSFNGNLYIGGDFTMAGGAAANHIARWNATDGWQSLGSGANGSVYAIESYNGRLHIGGTFTSAGGLSSPYWAIWEDNAAPSIAQQPQDDTIACGQSVTFIVVPASSSNPPSYQWRRNGANLSNGSLPNGSIISGTASATLTITNAGIDNTGDYDVILANPCGSATSDIATLSVFGCATCPADIAPHPDGDRIVNVDDLLAVISAWGSCPVCPADINADGFVEVDDLLAVISAWGPCP